MGERSTFDEYLFGGGLEADANKGVAKAIAELKAAGIEPAFGKPVKSTSIRVGPVNHRHPAELVKQAADMHPDVIRASLSHTALSRGASR